MIPVPLSILQYPQCLFEVVPADGTLPMDLLVAVLDQFPYKLHISRADGVLVYANRRFLDELLDETRTTAFGTYNILTDPAIEAWGIHDHVLRAFAGETILTQAVRFPGKELAGVRVNRSQVFQNLYQDIFSYPIRNADGVLTHVVTYFVPVEATPRHQGVMAAKAFIEAHWQENLPVREIARNAQLSASRLAELFREETGFTLHDYHLEVKLRQLRTLLLDPTHPIQKAFELAGFSYNSHYVRLFRSTTGMSPRQYRKRQTGANP